MSYRSLLFKLRTLRFWPPPPFGGGLETSYNVHLGLIGKREVNYLLVLIELRSLGAAAEALRAKIYQKSANSLQRGQFDPIFQVEEVALTNHICMDS